MDDKIVFETKAQNSNDELIITGNDKLLLVLFLVIGWINCYNKFIIFICKNE